jgi:hypothetical protein
VQRIEDRLGPLDDPDRLATPFHDQALAFLQGADVGHHRCAGKLGAGTGVPGFDERNSGESDADGAHHGCGGRKKTPTSGVDWIVYPIVGHPALRY